MFAPSVAPRLLSAVTVLLLLAGIVAADDDIPLSIQQPEYPRAFFFRSSEQAYNVRRFPTFESWESQFDRLQGIMGKCLEEECLGREPRNPEFFSRFKAEHPEQVVLLHFNGNARDPRYETDTYFPGHWIYRAAVKITQDVSPEEGESIIHVDSARGFRVNSGRYKTSNDDIALFSLTLDGHHNWEHCEQVQLLSVDQQANTIRVKRGCYGTRPLAFKANGSRAAPHQVEGPWGRNNHLMWYYNFSTHCPRDTEGRTCSDRLVADLVGWFGKGGKLAAFDGLEFDVMFNQTHGDTNGDGLEDDGVIDGMNHYGIGVVQFAAQLRAKMGDEFIIQGDGALGPGGSRSQRAWGILNGIESEGWPDLSDWEIADWSGGLNRHFFWRDNARQPAFNYVNHKWNQPVPDQPGARTHPDVPFSRHRLVFAVCQFFDAATCYSFAPPPDPDGRLGVWDELRCGTENQLGWLGRPEGPPLRLARQAPDMLSGTGTGSALAARITGPVTTSVTDNGVRIQAVNPAATRTRFSIKRVPTDGADLFLEVVLQGEPRRGYPRDMARFAHVGVSGGMIDLMAGEPVATGMKLRGAGTETEVDRSTGATVQRRKTTIDGQTLAAYFMHPPYRDGTGYCYWEQEVDVPAASELSFSIGMGEKSPERSDGVQFEVLAAKVYDQTPGEYTRIFQKITNQHQWQPESVPLDKFAGQRVRLRFVADCGPRDNATTDHANWGAVKIVTAGGEKAITEYREFMTWVNSQPFASGFYFQHIQSPTVDLAFDIEGKEPVTIRSVTARAHPDAMARLFQHGIVLANPSRKPFTFDLESLSPGHSYRRLQAAARQDPDTNNGRPVGPKVTLGERDGLFLKRVN